MGGIISASRRKNTVKESRILIDRDTWIHVNIYIYQDKCILKTGIPRYTYIYTKINLYKYRDTKIYVYIYTKINVYKRQGYLDICINIYTKINV